MTTTFNIYMTSDGQFFYKLCEANGRIWLKGEKYLRRSSVEQCIETIKRVVHEDDRYERKRSGLTWNPFFVLKGDYGEILGISEDFSSNAACEAGIAAVKHMAPEAPIVTLVDL